MTKNHAAHGMRLVLERLLTLLPHPGARARALRLFGATVGRNVRVHDARLFNLASGFSNLTIGDDVYIGQGVRIDLAMRVTIGSGTVISPGCTLLSHMDVGASHGNELVAELPSVYTDLQIGAHCYLGANVVICPGASLGPRTAVGAGAVVTREWKGNRLIAGVPAKLIRLFD